MIESDSRSLVLSDNACGFVQAVPGLPYDFARLSPQVTHDNSYATLSGHIIVVLLRRPALPADSAPNTLESPELQP